MPATYAINTAATFATAMLMACQPKLAFGTQDQDRTAAGLPKWEAQVAVTYVAEPGMRAVSEVIAVTIAAETDPAAGVPVPCLVEFTDLRMGVSTAEARQDDRGGARVRGGRPWFQASSIRQAHAQGRKAEQA